jgi:hypothetical protein
LTVAVKNSGSSPIFDIAANVQFELRWAWRGPRHLQDVGVLSNVMVFAVGQELITTDGVEAGSEARVDMTLETSKESEGWLSTALQHLPRSVGVLSGQRIRQNPTGILPRDRGATSWSLWPPVSSWPDLHPSDNRLAIVRMSWSPDPQHAATRASYPPDNAPFPASGTTSLDDPDVWRAQQILQSLGFQLPPLHERSNGDRRPIPSAQQPFRIGIATGEELQAERMDMLRFAKTPRELGRNYVSTEDDPKDFLFALDRRGSAMPYPHALVGNVHALMLTDVNGRDWVDRPGVSHFPRGQFLDRTIMSMGLE